MLENNSLENVSIFSMDSEITKKPNYKSALKGNNPLPENLYNLLKMLDQKHILSEYNFLNPKEKKQFQG